MREGINIKNVMKITGAFVAWVLGSGFATGQEILQFFASYGYLSFAVLAICLAGFVWVGASILGTGFEHNGDRRFSQAKYFCGEHIGRFYEFFIPVSMFAGLIIITSGAGATLDEYYGIDHRLGTLMMGALALAAFAAGFQKLVKVVSVIGPVIIAFTVIVGLVTVIRDFDGLSQISEAQAVLSDKQPSRFFWLSGLMYIGYNVAGASMYYTALGGSAMTRREAVLGASLGGTLLIIAIGLMNTAMLTDIETCGTLAIPTLYLAGKISSVLGGAFSIILLCGMFSTCSGMLWTVSTSLSGGKENKLIAAGIILVACIFGMFSFTDLIGIIYPYIGYISLIYIGCVAVKGAKGIAVLSLPRRQRL